MSRKRDPKYSLAELVALAGITPRTLRFYLSEGVLPPPLGRGRGKHYDDAHLVRLRALQRSQAMGMELSAIKRQFDNHYATEALYRGEYPPEVGFETEAAGALAADVAVPTASAWTRLELAPGLELHVSSQHQVPSAIALAQMSVELRALVGHIDEDESSNGPD